MAAHPLPQNPVKAHWTNRLKQQAGDIERLTAGLDEATLARRPIPEKWSLKELVVHLWRVQQVFEGRIRAMLAETNPGLASYDQNDEPEFLRLLESDGAELVQGFLRERGALVERLETLGPDDWSREGKHPEYARYDVEFCVEYLVFHEGHHLYQMLQRRMMV